MPRRADRTVKRYHVHLYEEDYLFLQETFASSDLGLAAAIRQIVHSYVLNTRAIAQRAIDTELDLNSIDSAEVDALLDLESES